MFSALISICLAFSSAALAGRDSTMQGFFTVTAPAIWILEKQDVLHGASGHFKVQVPC